MEKRDIDATSLGPNENLESNMHCFSPETGRLLQRQWSDIEVFTMPISTMSRINSMEKKKRNIKGIAFGDRKNLTGSIINE